MSDPDVEIMAYVDGELDAAAAHAFEDRLAADAVLAGRVERARALRDSLRAAYDPVLAEPVPEPLAALVRPPAPMANGDRVVDLAAARSDRAARRATAQRFGGWAMAASALLGVAVGLAVGVGGLGMSDTGEALTLAADGVWQARGRLDRALSQHLGDTVADTAGGGHDIRVGLSFLDRGGRYCRAFRTAAAPASAGLACRTGAAWQLELLAAAESVPSGPGLRPAASPWPAPVLQAIDAMRAGDPLDAVAERAARDRGWRR